MSITLTVGPDSPIEMSKLKDLEHQVKSIFDLSTDFHAYLDGPIASLPSDVRATTFGYNSGNQSWTAGGFGFCIGAGTCGKISVYTSGTLFSYPNGFPTEVVAGLLNAQQNKNTVKVPVPAGAAYLCLEFEFQLQGGISASGASGVFGVCASIGAGDTVRVAFSKLCKATDLLRDGIHAAFSDFVLPLHPATFANLVLGDYLHYNFNANLQLGLGASVGIAQVFYAAKCAADIPGTAGALQVTGELQPQAQLGARLAYQFSYGGTFEAILWKDSDTVGHMHLLRSTTQANSLGLTLGLTLTPAPTISTQVITAQVQDAFSRLLLGQADGKIHEAAAKDAASAIAGFAKDADDGINDWLKCKTGVKASLELAIEKMDQSSVLMDYTFDLAAAAYVDAFGLAVKGQFVDALALPGGGVSIATGSGIERLYSDKTSVHINLFGLLNAVWSSAVVSNATLVYAGNNIFHLIANVGAKDSALIGKSKSEIDLYFALEANISGDSETQARIGVHALLQGTGNPTFAAHIARVIGLLNLGPAGAQIAAAVTANAAVAGSSQMLHLVLEESAYQRLQASAIAHGKPQDQAPDRVNYSAFAQACSDLTLTPPASFQCQGQAMTYEIWSNWNIASNDAWPAPAGALPNRTSTGNVNAGIAYLQLQFPAIGTVAPLVGYALQAGSDFMNLCEALNHLATAHSIEDGMAGWPKFVASLKAIIDSDASPDFIVPVALALTRLCQAGAPTQVTGPVPGLPAAKSAAVTITYA